MRPGDAEEVRALPLFRDCRDDVYTELLANSFLQRFPPGVELIHEHDPADFLHVVVEGLVEMGASHAGRETTLSFVRPYGTFILAAVLKDQVYLQRARTLEKSRVLMIPAPAVRAAIHADNGFMAAVVVELATRYRDTVKELKNQKLRTGAERLANWLVRHHAEQGAAGTLSIGVEKRVLASRLGMTPENLSRAFATLGAYGVEVQGPKVVLSDLRSLERLAKPTSLIDDAAS
jgi:CRP/FNR family transcriptional activator FtrB